MESEIILIDQAILNILSKTQKPLNVFKITRLLWAELSYVEFQTLKMKDINESLGRLIYKKFITQVVNPLVSKIGYNPRTILYCLLCQILN